MEARKRERSTERKREKGVKKRGTQRGEKEKERQKEKTRKRERQREKERESDGERREREKIRTAHITKLTREHTNIFIGYHVNIDSNTLEVLLICSMRKQGMILLKLDQFEIEPNIHMLMK